MHRLNISYKQFYVTLNEIWLFESDPNAPSTWSEPGGKQWQRSIRGRRNWDVELGPCAVIRHLCSVAFVWETKRPQADNSRSLIDRQVSCYILSSNFRRCVACKVSCKIRNFGNILKFVTLTLSWFDLGSDGVGGWGVGGGVGGGGGGVEEISECRRSSFALFWLCK